MIDYTKPFSVKLEGLPKGAIAWVDLAENPAEFEVDLEGKTKDEVNELLEEGLNQFNNVINQAYKEDSTGYVQLGNTSISILEFAAIRASYTQ